LVINKSMVKKTKTKIVEESTESEDSTELVESTSPVSEEKVKVKVKRAPSAYNLFVKANISQFKDFPPRERMSKVSELWAMEKAKQ
jgi:hypothetical protein